MKRNIIVFLFILFLSIHAKADEGMWLPQLLEQLNEKKMKGLGMKISAKDIYSVNKGSLKDAIVHFGGGCTGEVISDKGLVLTNHHCGFDAIQNNSTIEHNYLKDGFWARNHAEELPNPGLTVTFIVSIHDVTNKVLKGVTSTIEENERQSIINKNISGLKKETIKESYQEIIVKPFFEGNQYFLIITEEYKDIRLVGAPPSAIGNFGKDTDNWMWPRHTGDFSLFRIYANKENKPAEYSVNNVPYKPKRSLAISLKGMKEGDFTMVFGFPGRTNQYLPAVAVEQIVKVNNPTKILIRDKTLGIMNKYMRSNEEIKLKYASKYAGIANAWKKWQGEILGIEKTGGIEKKLQYESVFQQRLNNNALLKAKYQNTLSDLNKAYQGIKPYGLARDYYLEIVSKIELFGIINRIKALRRMKDKANGQYTNELIEQIGSIEDIYKELVLQVDEEIFASLMEIYLQQETTAIAPEVLESYKQSNGFTNWAKEVYAKSMFADGEKILSLLKTDADKLYQALDADVAAKLIAAMEKKFNTEIAPELNQRQAEINRLQRTYLQAQMDVFKEKTFYPDANSTLRVTYGKVNGYKPADAKIYNHYTYLDGVMEKYIPGDYEFDVPQKLKDLYKNKDYGRYGVNGKMPVCFIGTNHTTGGNSGSPALDANGNLVGLNFDRVWEGTMSDMNYDPSICRNVMVDARYILFIIDKFAGAGHLLQEMKLITK